MKIALKWEKPLRLRDGSRQNQIYLCPNFERLSRKPGVYVFARKFGKGIVPLYIGQASKLRGRIEGQFNNLRITVEDEEIGNTDNFDFGSAEHRACQESRLIQDGHFFGDGISRFLRLLVQRGVAHIGESSECRQMVFLVPESEATQDLIVGTGSDFLFAVVPKEDPQIAACRTMI
jgi:hypothetical protein